MSSQGRGWDVLAYSRWPDRATRDAAWPGLDSVDDSIPAELRDIMDAIKTCVDMDRRLPEICMDVVDDLLIKD